jgi:hypothetical protein
MSRARTGGTGWICAANLEVNSISKIDKASDRGRLEESIAEHIWRALLGPGRSKGE